MRQIRASLRAGMARDRAMMRRHWLVYLIAGLLNLGLVIWALTASGQALTAEDAGRLQSLRYSYGSYNGGYMDFTLQREADGRLYLQASPMNGLTLNVHAPVGEEVLDELAALMAAEGIYAWNGFSGDSDILDGFSFGLQAEFEGGTLEAGAYEQYPKGFDQGHEALSGYLTALAERLLPTRLAGPEDIETVALHYYAEDLHFYISRDSTGYYHRMIFEQRGGGELSQEVLTAFFEQAYAFYNIRAESGRTGCSFAMEVQVNTGELQTILQLAGGVPEGEELCCEQTPLEDMALELVGRPADFLSSEAYALENYTNSFVYAGILVWDPEGLGEVRIDLPGRTVTVNGEEYSASMEAMRAFADAVDSQSLRRPFMSAGNEIEKTGAATGSARDWWDGLPKADYGWLYAVEHRNGYSVFAYGGEALPAEWAHAVREPVRALLEEIQ